MKIMFDTNVFDKLPDFIDQIKASQTEHEYYVTSIQVDELCEIPDGRKEIRKRNILMLADLRAKLVPVSVCVLGTGVRLGYVCLGDGEVYNKIIKSSGSNSSDALIADTSVSEGCVLVTEDIELLKRMRSNGYAAMEFNEFLEQL